MKRTDGGLTSKNVKKKKKRKRKKQGPAAWERKTGATYLRPESWRAHAVDLYVVGVAGYAGPWQGTPDDPAARRAEEAKEMLRDVLRHRQQEHRERLCVVSGATNAGVLALVYALCAQYDIRSAGVTAGQGLEHGLASMHWIVPFGRKFGDESQLFVDTLDELIVLGGGAQSLAEAKMAAAAGKKVVAIRGFGGAADAMTPADVPTAQFVPRPTAPERAT